MAATGRAKLADVAARAGVSVTTASYVLNGRAEHMRISSAAVERVRAAAAELSYRPNRTARNLRTASTKTIAVISDHVASGHYASRMLSGAAAAARASDHLLVIGETEGDPGLEEQLIIEMVDRQVDGILYATLATSRITVPAALTDAPVMLLNCLDAEGLCPGVVPDERAGGRLAARSIAGPGLGLPVTVVGLDRLPESIAGQLRVEGLRSQLEADGNSVATILPCLWDVEPAYDAVTSWLATGARPQALACLNDRIAMGAYQALREAGIAIPDQVPVVSFDGSDLATWLRPALTSVSIPYTELGARAADRLLSRDNSGDEFVPMPLLSGASTPPTALRA